MKLAMNLTVLAGRDFSQEETIPLLAEAGFDGCFWVSEQGVPLAPVAAKVREALEMEFIHAPVKGLDQLWQEGDVGEQRLNILSDWLRQCAAAGIPWMVSHVWNGFYEAKPNALGIDRLGRLLELAEREGVRIAFENCEQGAFLTEVRRQLWSSPAVGFCFDTGHELCYSDGEDQLAQCGDRLLCTHLNDNLGRTGESYTSGDDAHMMPFDGLVDWDGVARRLKERNYTGTLTFEIKMKNKPGRHTHDRYAALSPREILTLARERAVRFAGMLE